MSMTDIYDTWYTMEIVIIIVSPWYISGIKARMGLFLKKEKYEKINAASTMNQPSRHTTLAYVDPMFGQRRRRWTLDEHRANVLCLLGIIIYNVYKMTLLYTCIGIILL